MRMLKVYGLKNCDTCRKARRWLSENAIEHTFFDLRETPVTRDEIAIWAEDIGVDVLLNKRGTTWRNLPETDKAVTKLAALIDLMHRHPALIKRPVFVSSEGCLVGFSADTQERLASCR